MRRLAVIIKLQKPFIFVFIALIIFCTMKSVSAISPVRDEGTWPKSWPIELEPLRKQAWTIGPDGRNPTKNESPITHLLTRYEIPFFDREKFESAWPHILKLNSKETSVILLRGHHLIAGPDKTAGIRIVTRTKVDPSNPTLDRLRQVLINLNSKDLGPGIPPSAITEIHLVIDGKIVDLNRIHLPRDTPIIDKRFNEKRKK